MVTNEQKTHEEKRQLAAKCRQRETSRKGLQPEYALTLEGEGVLSAATEEMTFQGKGTETTAKSKEGQASGWDIKTQC